MVVMITISRVPHLVWAQSTSQTTLGYKQQQHQQQYTKTLNKSAVANDKTKVRLMGEGGGEHTRCKRCGKEDRTL